MNKNLYISFVSKLLEKIVASQLQSHLCVNNILDPYQSGFRLGHSTETALVKMTYGPADSGLLLFSSCLI